MLKTSAYPVKASTYSAKIQQMLLTALGVYLIVLLLAYPALSLEYASKGLVLWFNKMIPTLLPFMILSGIMIRMNLTHKCVGLFHPLLGRLYGTSPNGTYTILMGFLCGFPMGARIVGELLEAGRISRREGSFLLSFCNNIGPIYFLSFVVPMLRIRRPLLPFCIMYGLPLLYGMAVMRMPGRHSGDMASDVSFHQGQSLSLPAAVDASVVSGLTGIAKLGGYMVFFNLLNIVFVPFENLPALILRFYNCILEITSGIDRCGHFNPYLVLILLPFGGFSCFAQTYSMIQHTDLSLRPYLFHKLMQTGITALCYILWHPF
ncbi:hypothetical protein D7V83_01410 [bacterium 0.1xD8-71]|nr:hypothetical protein D7V83_01410 [bacterium 0.1xD8-71]